LSARFTLVAVLQIHVGGLDPLTLTLGLHILGGNHGLAKS